MHKYTGRHQPQREIVKNNKNLWPSIWRDFAIVETCKRSGWKQRPRSHILKNEFSFWDVDGWEMYG